MTVEDSGLDKSSQVGAEKVLVSDSKGELSRDIALLQGVCGEKVVNGLNCPLDYWESFDDVFLP